MDLSGDSQRPSVVCDATTAHFRMCAGVRPTPLPTQCPPGTLLPLPPHGCACEFRRALGLLSSLLPSPQVFQTWALLVLGGEVRPSATALLGASVHPAASSQAPGSGEG